jgi:hypothetical protein
MALENIRSCIAKYGTGDLLDALPLPEDLLWIQHSVANPKTALVIGKSGIFDVVAYLTRYGEKGMSGQQFFSSLLTFKNRPRSALLHQDS